MKKMVFTMSMLAVTLALVVNPVSTEAAQEFVPKVSLSDGKDGRPAMKWKQAIKEHKVRLIIVEVQRTAGGDDTFFNLRFGDKGQTLENGRRIYLKSNERQTITINVGGVASGGEPLVINAYNGTVLLKWVQLHYQ